MGSRRLHENAGIFYGRRITPPPKIPKSQKRRERAKVKEMEDIIRKSMQEIQQRRHLHSTMIQNYNEFSLLLYRLREFELSRFKTLFLTQIHKQSHQLLFDENLLWNNNLYSEKEMQRGQ